MVLPLAPTAMPYAGPVPREGDPGVATGQPEVLQAWNQISPDRLTELCDMAYVNGDYGYISTALRANFLMTNEMTTRIAAKLIFSLSNMTSAKVSLLVDMI